MIFANIAETIISKKFLKISLEEKLTIAAEAPAIKKYINCLLRYNRRKLFSLLIITVENSHFKLFTLYSLINLNKKDDHFYYYKPTVCLWF